MFFNEAVFITADEGHSQSEHRYRALGENIKRVFINGIFTLRENETLIRVISARNMNAKERKSYENETKRAPEV